METAVDDGGVIGREDVFGDISMSKEVNAVSNLGVADDTCLMGELGAVSKTDVIGDVGVVMGLSGLREKLIL